ncbi:MAG TPA: hypothetical protein VHE35_28725, partial [Kofleriaceae bacterium]|nr:hypothetical protein [Kofleriaceae bacterium]
PPGPSAAPAALPSGRSGDLSFKQVPLRDLVGLLAQQCAVNVIIPDEIQATVSVDLKAVPCDQALEVVLESNGLWYTYRPDGNLVRIAPRAELDLEERERAERLKRGVADQPLPDGPPVSLDVVSAPIRDVLRTITAAGGVNIVVPDDVQARLTMHGRDLPWTVALQAVLEAQGLWYRYRPNGKIVRVAPRAELDLEERTGEVHIGQAGDAAPAPPAPPATPALPAPPAPTR